MRGAGRAGVLDLAVVIGVGALVAFPFLAKSAASDPAPLDATAPVVLPRLPPPGKHPAPQVRTLPVATAGGMVDRALANGRVLHDRDAMMRALDAAATAALGPDGPAQFATQDPSVIADVTPTVGQAHALTDLGVLLFEAMSTYDEVGPVNMDESTPFAVRLLDLARRAGTCDAQLDYVLATLSFQSAADLDAAVRACPGDVTPEWLRGEWEMRTSALTAAPVRFLSLEQRFPRSPAGWAGEADVDLLRAEQLRATQPFVALSKDRHALSLLERARSLAPPSARAALDYSIARALVRIGTFSPAEVRLRRLMGAAPTRNVALHLAEVLEHEQRFRAAADVLARPRPDWLVTRYLLPRALIDLEPAPLAFSAGILGNRAVVEAAEYVVDLSFLPERPVVGPYSDFAADHLAPVTSTTPMVLNADAYFRDLVLAGASKSEMAAAATKLGPQWAPEFNAILGLERGRRDEVVALIHSAPPYTFVPDPQSHYGTPEAKLLGDLERTRSDLWRFGRRSSDLRHAAVAMHDLTELDPTNEFTNEQSGEVAYWAGEYARTTPAKQGSYLRAARFFDHAATLTDATGERVLDQVRQAVALRKAGRDDSAAKVLDDASHVLATHDLNQSCARGDSVLVSGPDGSPLAAPWVENSYADYYLQSERAMTQLHGHRTRAAVQSFEAARAERANLQCTAGTIVHIGVHSEALDNNEGTAMVAVGRARDALPLLDAALKVDHGDPIFLSNRAWAFRKLHRTHAAIVTYRQALTIDPGNYPAANDLGVLLAEEGEHDEAAGMFRQALAANRKYALAWFNLGVLQRERGLGHVFEAQGALARAGELDHGLAEAERELRFDDSAVFTTLDLSKPLPPRWSFSVSEERSGYAVSALLVILVVWRVGRTLAREKVGEKFEEWIVDSPRIEGIVARLRHPGLTPVIAIVATIGLVMWPLVREHEANASDLVLLGGVGVVLLLLYLRAHRWSTPPGEAHASHATWTPGVALGAAAGAVGLRFFPFPVAPSADRERAPDRLVVPLALTALAAVLVLLTVLTRVPATRIASEAAIGAAASTLLPIEPNDGAYIARERMAIALSIALLILTAVVVAGLS